MEDKAALNAGASLDEAFAFLLDCFCTAMQHQQIEGRAHYAKACIDA
jgi:hypothetical protein